MTLSEVIDSTLVWHMAGGAPHDFGIVAMISSARVTQNKHEKCLGGTKSYRGTLNCLFWIRPGALK